MKTPKITKLPSGAYHARVQIGGRRVSVTADSPDVVERKILALKLGNGNIGRSVTLYDAITDYIESKRNVLSPSTIRGYESIQKNRFQAIMFRKLSDKTNWQRVVNDEARICSAKTLKNAWGFVRSVLKENGFDADVRLPSVMPKDRPFLQPEEIKKFITAIRGDHFEILYLLCLHGLRRSEAFAIEKKDVTDAIRVNKARVQGPGKTATRNATKNASSTRTVPIFVDRLKELVADAPEGRLCRHDPHWVNKHLAKVCESNGLPVVSLHELRHSFASLCYHLQIPELQCMELGGWSDLSTMRKIYTHVADADRKAAADALKAFAVE